MYTPKTWTAQDDSHRATPPSCLAESHPRASSPHTKKREEAQTAARLAHPNIVNVYDVGEDNGKYFIVMEYVDGKTLKGLIKKRGPLNLSESIDIMLQLTSGIACAHQSYIIHRDIKPQNVMILEDGRVKITDFGIALIS